MRTSKARVGAIAVVALGAALAVVPVPAGSKPFPPQVARGVTVPAGFVARVFAQVPPPYLPTSLTWAESPADIYAEGDARAAGESALHGVTLYVTAVSGNVFSGTGNGALLAYEDEGGQPRTLASGLDQPLGVAVDPADKTVFVSENANGRGRVTALTDGDGDGLLETRRTVLKNLPNGRHQTNGLTFGTDGMLYVANGNATDDGIECGPEPIVPLECDHPEIKPWSGSILKVDPSWTDVDLMADIRLDADGVAAADGMDDESVLVSSGYRNIYDIDFDPRHPTTIWTPMNGPDDPSGSEPLYSVDVADQKIVGYEDETPVYGPNIEDAGFPSCIYDPHDNEFPTPQPLGGHDHPGFLDPQNNPNQDVIAKFGPCNKDAVIRPQAIYAEGHEGTSGMSFVRGNNFPERYRGDLFTAEWGSIWNLNGLRPTGHKIIHMDVRPDGTVQRQREFMSGVLPMDVTFGPNGHMYVADMSGQIYDVSHLTDAAAPDVVTIDMRSGQFVPQVVTIVRGQTVKWCNLDSTPHNVRAFQKIKVVDPLGAEPIPQPGTEMNSSGDVAPGSCHSHTFDAETAVYLYRSTTSAVDSNTMWGTIVVTPAER